ncbi:crotonobetainyl-CoA:carnitine CoA-transferase CaiB-like acyl-CoA transferase [Stella humosa]|uniref:Crotonobetainyl-CoA:carnitine CoA-transferase CaiB-like acyl-CoA transferase n=1 Tax=Stella humosa TaxID=94 RepID=A0A3N1KYN7_9PROT|nr:CaiB/BaiF CoA-transferase family protein [Stella humosa]ROP83316.1 crotonobetainyl-CoA:carnitine CoA-transferase CaiB-like acyl-CoA transferase [Stella humosa]BBK29901.1 CoA transferase [Stella humosa]
MTERPLPLDGIRVVEMTHTIMGPSCGVALADLGADVIKIEPAPAGDHTRRLPGFASGFFTLFNRNKRSLAVDLKTPEGREVVNRLLAGADVLLENFGPGTADRLGMGWEDARRVNPRLVYCALKGFLSGPYENRPALDEIVQFMSGIAYMTGPPGRPLRAGASIIDILGGAYGAIAILAALRERDRTGEGQFVKSALFESGAFLMGSHMAGHAITGEKIPPMPARRGAWAVYDPFNAKDGEQVFVGITSNGHWHRFCDQFADEDPRLASLRDDPALQSNEDRVAARPRLVALVGDVIARLDRAQATARLEQAEIPFAPVVTTEDLFDDPQLNANGYLMPVRLPSGATTKLPKLPVEMDSHDLGLRLEAPTLGEHSRAVLAELGYAAEAIADLEARRIIVGPAA